MSTLQNKTILVISPQDWGKMLLSKHHYAIELAKAGNKVYFLNPPAVSGPMASGTINIEQSSHSENLWLVSHRLYFPYFIKFKSMWLFHLLLRPHIRNLVGKIGRPIDIIWSFDIGNLYPFKLFPGKALQVFHPVDEPLRKEAIDAARGANVIFSVTKEILEKYNGYPVRKEFINHGVSERFLDVLAAENSSRTAGSIKVGYAGNLLRGDMDRPIILKIVAEHPELEFHFFGSYQTKGANIGGTEDAQTKQFIDTLAGYKQVKLHGILDQQQLAKAFSTMDAFLVCYDIEKDQSKGTNYHKLMEYIATGKIVISNNITTYQSRPDLIQMTHERNNNDKLPALFTNVISQLEQYNSTELEQMRKEFARSNTYTRQVQRISTLLEGLQ